MSSGDSTGIDFATIRGRDYPSIRQFTVFLENRVGQLLEVVRRFEGTQKEIEECTGVKVQPVRVADMRA